MVTTYNTTLHLVYSSISLSIFLLYLVVTLHLPPAAPTLSCVHIYPYPLHLVWYYILYLPYLLPLYLVHPSPVPPHLLTKYRILEHLIWRIKYPYTPYWNTSISHKVILYPQYAQPPPSCTAPVSPMHSAQPATRRERAAVSAFWVVSVKVHWPTPVWPIQKGPRDVVPS